MKSFYEKLCKIELYAAIFCLVTSVAIIFISALLRSIGNPVNWAIDIALLLFTWSTFLGADIAYQHNSLVNVDIFVTKLPIKVQKAIKFVCYILSIIFIIAMIYYGIDLCFKSWSRSFQGIPGFSYTWVTLSIPVSFSFLLITSLRKVYFEFFCKETSDLAVGK